MHRDRTTKQRIYANAGIPQYLIINLQDGVVESYLDPIVGKGRHARSQTLAAGKKVEIMVRDGKPLRIRVRDLVRPPAG